MEHLSVASAGITDDLCTIIGQHLCKLSSLKSLDLRYNNIGAFGGLCIIKTLCHLSCMEKLDLSSNPIGNSVKTDKLLCGLKGLTKLRYLNLADTGLNERSIAQLCISLTHMRNLQVLNLSENHIGNTAKILAQILQSLTNLVELDLSNTAVGGTLEDAPILYIISSLKHMPDLQVLKSGIAAKILAQRLQCLTNLVEL